jgi:adenine specific DNA methylase Mod
MSSSKIIALMNEIFEEKNWVANFVRKSGIAPRQDIKYIANAHDYILSYAKRIEQLKVNQKPSPSKGFDLEDEYVKTRGKHRLNKLDRGSIHYSESLDYPILTPDGTEIWPGGDPKDKRWIWRWSKKKFEWGITNGYIVFKKSKEGIWQVYYKEYELVDNEGKPRERMNPYDTLILECQNEKGNREIEDLFGKRVFEYPKPCELIIHLGKIGSFKDSLILDFFAGSGTTAHSVMKLNKEDGGKRKFILVEMADYFETIIIPRIKKVAYSFNWKEGKPQDNDGIGIFFKYYELEQFEEILRKTKYKDIEEPKTLFDKDFNYIFTTDPKMLDALELDYENNKVKLDLSKIYPEKQIDIAETISNLLGKWIKKITKDEVIFEDGEKINLNELDYKIIKSLIWWR